MKNTKSEESTVVSTFKSPTEMFKIRLLSLLFECIDHNSKSHSTEELYAFARKAWDLSVLLERYTPTTKRKELSEWKKQLESEIKKASDTANSTERKKAMGVLDYRYAVEVHLHNQRILTNSPILEVDVEGDLDITDESIKDIVRLKGRQDARRVEFKQ